MEWEKELGPKYIQSGKRRWRETSQLPSSLPPSLFSFLPHSLQSLCGPISFFLASNKSQSRPVLLFH